MLTIYFPSNTINLHNKSGFTNCSPRKGNNSSRRSCTAEETQNPHNPLKFNSSRSLI